MSAQMTASAPNSTPRSPSKAFIAIGFVLATFTTTALTSLGGVVVSDMQAKRAQKIEQVNAFDKSTQLFVGLVENYSTALIDNKGIQEARSKLEDNIQDQHAQLKSAKVYLHGNDIAEADLYLKTLEDMADALQTAKDPVTAMPFARAAVKQAEQCDEVVLDLKKSAGIASDSKPQ
jgi:hypothetical protein